MRADKTNGGDALIESVLGWWELAGVDLCVDDRPRDWLAPPPRPAEARPATAAPTAPAEADSGRNFASVEELAGWLCDPVNLPALGPARIAPEGSPASGVMILADAPDPEDGRVGLLLDAMLAAIGRDRESVYLAQLAPAPIPGGLIDSPIVRELAAIARRHVALAAPRTLLLMGDAASRALIGTNLAQARGKVHRLNLDETAVEAIATFPPRFLLRQPARKADAWADLRLFLETMTA